MTLPDRIRAAIGPAHAAIEATPFAAAMVTGRIAPDDYTAGLCELFHLHAALEAALDAAVAHTPALAAVYDAAKMNRSGLIAADLAALGAYPTASAGSATAALTDQIAGWAAADPVALLGPLYVLEGSRMGSMVLVRSLAPALGAERRPGAGLDYHLDGIATRPMEWQRFRGTLAGLPLTDAAQAAVLAAATATMTGLVELYAALTIAEPAACA